jgi:hypothetical protein
MTHSVTKGLPRAPGFFQVRGKLAMLRWLHGAAADRFG